jgi:hypothetical protein
VTDAADDRPAMDAAAADAAAFRSGSPLPAGVAPARRFLDTAAKLVGGHSCSHQEPASGDGHRWCAFSLPGATAGALELWVIDVTRAAAGQVPRCDGSDPGCLRLTDQLWTAFSLYGPAHPFSHAFEGDTLIYYVGAAPKSDSVYRGLVYAWRPGWPRPRALTTEKGLVCFGHPRTAVAFCIEDVVGDPAHPDSFEVHAGSMADPTGGPLPAAERIHPFRSSGGDAVWGWAFTQSGDLFALASPDPDPAVAAIRVVATKDVGRVTPAVIVRDATNWTLSPDATKVYFVREAADGARNLHMADFPSGAGAVKLQDEVDDYLLAGSMTGEGVGALARHPPNQLYFRLFRDRTRPTDGLVVFTATNMLEGLEVSRDLRYTAWVSAMFQARVVRHADVVSCLLNTSSRRPAYFPRFSDNTALVFWEEDGLDDSNRRDGFLGRPEDCQGRTRFAQGLDFYHLLGDRGIIYGDELDSQYRVTLKYAPLVGGKEWPAEGPVRIHELVKTDKRVILAGNQPALLVFEVGSGDPAQDGVYVFAAPL